MKTIPKGTLRIQEKEILLFTDVYEGGAEHDNAEVWDYDEHIFSVPSHDENVLKYAIIAYNKGFEAGKVDGRVTAQAQMRKAMGVE